MRKLIVQSRYALGDAVALTAAVRDLHRCYPGMFVTDVRTPCGSLWNYNPYLTHLDENDPDVELIDCDVSLTNYANSVPYHILEAFIDSLNAHLGLQVRCSEHKGDVYLSLHEKRGLPQVHALAGRKIPYWILFGGGRHEITIKWWDSDRYQQVVDHFAGRIQFVQAGGADDWHPKLRGTIDLRGKTSIRELIQLMYHSQGVLSGVTGPMHLAAAVEMKDRPGELRPCVVVAGGREAPHWASYPGHQYIHNVGSLKCCARGGCWRVRTFPLGDGTAIDDPAELCRDVKGHLPRCMDMITAGEVARRIELYFGNGRLRYLNQAEAAAARKAVERTRHNPLDSRPPALADLRYAAERHLPSIPVYPEEKYEGNGIVLYGKQTTFAHVWLTAKLLRQFGCTLPLEYWHWRSPEINSTTAALLDAIGVTTVDLVEQKKFAPFNFAKGPLLQPYVITHCSFENILFLGTDALPLADPACLFQSADFKATGAICWPTGERGPTPAQAWHLCGLKPSKERPICSDLLLLNKRKSWRALALWVWYHRNWAAYQPVIAGKVDPAQLALRKGLVNFSLARRQGRHGRFYTDAKGRRLFQERNYERSYLFSPGGAFRDFAFEQDCLHYLEELSTLRRARDLPASKETTLTPKRNGHLANTSRLDRDRSNGRGNGAVTILSF